MGSLQSSRGDLRARRSRPAARRRDDGRDRARPPLPRPGCPDARHARAWLELPAAADRLRWLSAVAGLDLIRLGTTADADEIKDTAVTQPLLVAAALAAAAELELPPASPDVVVAGHSVGELAAAALAGVSRPEAAVALARVRGAEMAAACALAPTGMSAVLGGDADEVLAAIEALGLTPANRNGAGQIVAAGATDALAEARRGAAGRRARCGRCRRRRVPHPVHGAGRGDASARVAAGVTVARPASCCCCPTRTAPRCTGPARCATGWSAR